MLYTDAFDSAPLFVGSTHIAVENEETSEMAREWTRRQLAEAAARLSPPPRQIVDLPPKFGPIPSSTHAALSA
jgi:DNA-directed RNA polymerase specialized sigma24 family protein